jgi:hypothetical protein
MLAIGIIVPDACIIFYGLEKRHRDFPMFIIGSFLCAYLIYLLQKIFLYKIVVYDDYMEINTPGSSVCIRYEDILDIQFKRNACYIVDRIDVDGDYYIRGTDKKLGNNIKEVEIAAGKLPVLQRPFLTDYNELVEYIIYKCSALGKNIGNLKYSEYTGRSPLISAALMKDISEGRAGVTETFKVLWPYFLMLLIAFMCMVMVIIIGKGYLPWYLVRYIRLIFPVSVVVVTYILALKYINCLKNILGRQFSEMEVSRNSVIIYLVCNIAMSYCIIALFFYLLNRVIIYEY